MIAQLSPRQQRRNVLFLGADLALFMAAVGLLAPTTLVPLFISKLTDNPLAIGASTAAFQIGWLPQLFAVGYVERSSRKLPWLVVASGLERLPALGLVLCALAAPSVAAPIVLAFLYVCRFGQSLAGGLAATSWLDLVARAVSPRRRGRFMGGFTTLGNLFGAASALLAAPLLDWLGFPYGFAACFGLAFLILLVGYVPLFLVVEPPGPPPREPRRLDRQLGELPTVLAADKPFRRFLGGMALGALSGMSASFLVVYAAERLGAEDELAAWYTVALLVAEGLGNLGFGWLADRAGFTTVARISALAVAAMAVSALAAPGPIWLAVSFVFLGLAQAGGMLSKITGPIEFAPPDRRPSYVALGMGLLGLVAAIAPLIGGQVVAALGYQWLFYSSLAFSLASALVLGKGARPPARVPTPARESI
ncbi:MAG TPA: MFS transporter [Chloroflexota bacterium]|nr:MFS transporter [Chloroflexota bacterium]